MDDGNCPDCGGSIEPREPVTRWDKVIDWMDRTKVPVNYLSLAVSLGVLVAFVIQGEFGIWFGLGVALAIWSAWDIAKWRRRKRQAKAKVNNRPIGPEDTPEWSANNKQG